MLLLLAMVLLAMTMTTCEHTKGKNPYVVSVPSGEVDAINPIDPPCKCVPNTPCLCGSPQLICHCEGEPDCDCGGRKVTLLTISPLDENVNGRRNSALDTQIAALEASIQSSSSMQKQMGESIDELSSIFKRKRMKAAAEARAASAADLKAEKELLKSVIDQETGLVKLAKKVRKALHENEAIVSGHFKSGESLRTQNSTGNLTTRLQWPVATVTHKCQAVGHIILRHWPMSHSLAALVFTLVICSVISTTVHRETIQKSESTLDSMSKQELLETLQKLNAELKSSEKGCSCDDDTIQCDCVKPTVDVVTESSCPCKGEPECGCVEDAKVVASSFCGCLQEPACECAPSKRSFVSTPVMPASDQDVSDAVPKIVLMHPHHQELPQSTKAIRVVAGPRHMRQISKGSVPGGIFPMPDAYPTIDDLHSHIQKLFPMGGVAHVPQDELNGLDAHHANGMQDDSNAGALDQKVAALEDSISESSALQSQLSASLTSLAGMLKHKRNAIVDKTKATAEKDIEAEKALLHEIDGELESLQTMAARLKQSIAVNEKIASGAAAAEKEETPEDLEQEKSVADKPSVKEQEDAELEKKIEDKVEAEVLESTTEGTSIDDIDTEKDTQEAADVNAAEKAAEEEVEKAVEELTNDIEDDEEDEDDSDDLDTVAQAKAVADIAEVKAEEAAEKAEAARTLADESAL